MANVLIGADFSDESIAPTREKQRSPSDQQLLERFVSQRDENAFAALVERYGRAVWHVCRRLLYRQHDVEDAFQAVFLILSRKAASIRKTGAVGSWLYGVAYRTAVRAKKNAGRRQSKEKEVPPASADNPAWSEAAARELQIMLDEEINRLPEKYRAPFVLCCLEGMSRAEAAQELGWKEGTLSSRLAQARKLLQMQLARRGVTLSAALAVVELTKEAASAAVPPLILQTTLQAALAPAAGQTACASPAAMSLANALWRGFLLTKLKMAVACFCGLFVLVAGTVLVAVPLPKTNGKYAQEFKFDFRGAILDNRFSYPGGGVRDLAISRDGQTLAIGCPEGFIYVFDLPTATLRHQLHGHSTGLWCVAISPDGQTLASGSGVYKQGEIPGEVILWDLAKGTRRITLKGHQGSAFGLEFSPDGKTLFSCGWDEVVRVWDPSTGEEKAVLRGHKGPVRRIHCTPDGKFLLSGGFDSTVRYWNCETLKEERQITITRHEGLATSALSPDGKWLITGSRQSAPPDPNIITVWDVEAGKEIRTIDGPTLKVTGLAVSPDKKLLAMGGGESRRFNAPKQFGEVKVFDLATGAELAHFDDHQEFVASLAFSPDGRWLVSGSGRGAGVPGELRIRDMTQLRVEAKPPAAKPVVAAHLPK